MCLNFSHLQRTPHLMQNTYRDFFSTAQNSFWTHRFGGCLVLLPFFISPLLLWQNVSLWGLFSSRETKKVTRGEVRWVGRVMMFLVKNCWTLSAEWAGALVNHPSWNGQMHWKSLQKNALKPNAASHNNTSWYMDTDGFLEHSPSGGSLCYKGPALRKIILFWGGPQCVYH